MRNNYRVKHKISEAGDWADFFDIVRALVVHTRKFIARRKR
jgi:hypothetical protein